ncbi:putative viral structural protein [Sulfolobales Beppu filamentous virus 2]|uniref:Putative viral structural protein n=1 Tax=Sulfolobales Beppu filamentous virus 2 TaxID=2493123 RepID=A0A3Q8Q3S0_9VIRU|nr:putative viral structural protein [Sulfolobales Beppu filamentous virus 2]AZI75809.1 putative viral structural protein [Sulfolobales Beppu filamentous virus 2]
MKLLTNAVVTDIVTKKTLRKKMVLAQVFDEVEITVGVKEYDVGIMIENINGDAYILQPNLAVKIDESLMEKLKNTKIYDANINIFALPGVYK